MATELLVPIEKALRNQIEETELNLPSAHDGAGVGAMIETVLRNQVVLMRALRLLITKELWAAGVPWKEVEK